LHLPHKIWRDRLPDNVLLDKQTLPGNIAGRSGMMKNVVVTAACRKAGKTLLASAVVEVLSRAGRKVAAFKISRRHGQACELLEGPGRASSDTWRLSRAGAARVALVKAAGLDDIARICSELPGDEDVCVWESNAMAGLLNPDCLVFISVPDCPDSKSEASVLESVADIVVRGPLDEDSAQEAAERIALMMGEGANAGEPTP
jgi:hypothetical protein